jgi:hypothetical protein
MLGGALFTGYLGCAKDASDPDAFNRVHNNPNDNDPDEADASSSGSGNSSGAGGTGGTSGGGTNTGGTSGAGMAGAGGEPEMSDAGDACGGCDDGSDCTEDVCTPMGTCTHIAVDNDLPCTDDNNGCTTDVCIGGFCTHQAIADCDCSDASECDDANPCTDDDCVSSHCQYTDNTDDCTDDGNECTNDLCALGACTHPNNTDDCTDDGNECTDDLCALGVCTHPNNTDDCTDDGNDCTDDVCATGACTHPNNTDPCTSDNNPCTNDVCAGGSCYANNTDPCTSDNNPCTNDVCAGGSCYANNTDPCTADAFECTDDVCAGGTCTHPNRTGACTSDGTDCTDDVCNAGVCTHPISANTVACTTDGDPCTSDHCDGVVASCLHTPVACGSPFTVNSFNGGWATLTKPDNHTMVVTNPGGAANFNPEGATLIYVGSAVTCSIAMSITQPSTPQNLNGLTNLAFVMSGTTGSEGMVKIGLSVDGTAWTDRALTGYVTFTGVGVGNYQTFNVALADFGVSLAPITQVRVQFEPTGGGKEWRIDNIAAN